jgi:hypothetical protein
MFKCLNPDPKRYVAWWMLTFPVDTVYITNVLIYYRGNSKFFIRGNSSIYLSKRGRAAKTINKQWCKYLHEFILQLNIVMSNCNT